MTKRVVIVGAGVAGLSAAHELLERGMSVTVLEAAPGPGGRSRSMPHAGTGTCGRPDLPAEHGFRFFPAFYRHLPDTLARIPHPDGGTVADRLVCADEILGRTEHGASWRLPGALADSDDALALIRFLTDSLMGANLGVPRSDLVHIARKWVEVLTACEARAMAEYEQQSAWDFIEADRLTPQARRYFVSGLTRQLVACRADRISARTCISIGLQLVLGATGQSDRLLSGPTNDVWFTPWLAHLAERGADLRFSTPVRGLVLGDDGRLTGVQAEGGLVEADAVIMAVSRGAMQRLTTPRLLAAAPSLGGLPRLDEDWMSGCILYFREVLDFGAGHSIFLDSPWALTALSQGPFWPDHPLHGFGDGSVGTVLSLCISDWDAPGVLTGRSARQCSRDEIIAEVREQVRRHLHGADRLAFERATLADAFLDPALRFGEQGVVENREPLLINTAGSWAHRPEAHTGIANLFLAGDYVRTHTDLATMEGANEAARRAVNGILDAFGIAGDRCGVWSLPLPAWAHAARQLDLARFESGQPHALPGLWQTGQQVGAFLRAQLSVWGMQARFAPTPSRPRPASPVTGLLLSGLDVSGLGTSLERRMIALEGALAATGHHRRSGSVHRAVRAFLDTPGKRIRALCVFLAASIDRQQVPAAALPLAVSVELVHGATLLHDDVIDRADLRRGKPTVARSFGSHTSILAGDLLFAEANRALLATGRADLAADLLDVIDNIIAGESAQLDALGGGAGSLEEALWVLEQKTAALFSWACRAAGRLMRQPEVWTAALDDYGRHLGIAFQLVDDLLDLTGETGAIGKDAMADFARGHLSFPLLLAGQRDPGGLAALTVGGVRAFLVRTDALQLTRDLAAAHLDQATGALSVLPDGPAREVLDRLAVWSVGRRL